MIRYENVDDTVTSLLDEVCDRHFPELRNAKIVVLFDCKKAVKGGRLRLGEIKKPNDLIRHFTRDEAAALEGYDYIIILDKVCWQAVSKPDRTRILRHELRHTFYDIESESNPYRLIDHTITDFYEEVELNKDDPRWAARCGALTADIYDQMKEEATEGKKRGKKAKREYLIHPRQGTIEGAPTNLQRVVNEANSFSSATISHVKEDGTEEEIATFTKQASVEGMNPEPGPDPDPPADSPSPVSTIKTPSFAFGELYCKTCIGNTYVQTVSAGVGLCRRCRAQAVQLRRVV